MAWRPYGLRWRGISSRLEAIEQHVVALNTRVSDVKDREGELERRHEGRLV